MSASGSVGRLLAVLGINSESFRRGIREAQGDLERFGNGVRGVGRGVKAALGLTVAGIGLQQLASRARAAVRDIASIGDEAKRAGMSLRAFQEWKFVAEQNRIGIDAMVDGFKELNLRADEFIITGGGGAADAFQRLGFSADELKKKIKDPSALMLEIIGRLQKMDRAAQIRISDELFGGSAGERFVELLDQGQEGIRKTISRAHELGAVMSNDVVAKAEELDRRFNEVATSIENNFKRGVIAAADLYDKAFGNEASMVEWMGMMDRANQVMGEELVKGLLRSGDALAANEKQIKELNSQTWDLVNTSGWLADALIDAADAAFELGNQDLAQVLVDAGTAMDALVDDFEKGDINAVQLAEGIGKVREKADEAIASLGDVDAASMEGVISEVNRLGRATAAAAGMVRSLVGWLSHVAGVSVSAPGEGADPDAPELSDLAPTDGRGSKRPQLPGVDSYGDFLDAQSSAGGKGKGGGGRSKDDYAKAVASITEETAALEAEALAFAYVASAGVEYADAVEYARTRAELLAAAQAQGKDVTPELLAEVDALALAYVNAGDAAEQAAKQLEQVAENSKDGADAIGNIFGAALEGSDAAKRAVAQLILEIARAQMMSAAMGFFGGTGVAKFIGGLLNVGANAGGTNNWRGGLTRVNELGGEIMNLPKGTQIIPADVSRRMADGAAQGAGTTSIEVVPSPYFELAVDQRADVRIRRAAPALIGGSVQAAGRASRKSKSFFGLR